MERFALKQLIEWKNSKNRKPLVLRGARQVGKTYLMKEFGKRYFSNFVYFNFDENQKLKEIFETTKDSSRILEQLRLIANSTILQQKTLIIFDEIQECPDALNSLKYFYENVPEYVIISAGSLLGILLSKPYSYPVGQINILDLYPLSFEEFLCAIDKELYSIYEKIEKDSEIPAIIHDKLVNFYHYYLIVGGMPEAVKSWIEERDPNKILRIQKELIEIYEVDISKHHGKINVARILMVFRNIVTQLSKENHKFIYGTLRSGARAREFEEAIEWLVSANLVNRVYCSSNNLYPLTPYDNFSAFKLYFFDTGLLKCLANLTNQSIILDMDFTFKGALTENYVCQQLRGRLDVPLKYFTFNHYEIDFLLQHNEDIIPIEVKSSTNTSSSSSIAYKKQFKPLMYIRYSLLNYKKDNITLNIPLYLVCKTNDLL